MNDKTLKYYGWGYADAGLDADQTKALIATFREGFGIEPSRDGAFPTMDEIALPAPKIVAPSNLSGICSTDKHDRVVHAFGQSQPDSIRIYDGDFAHAPDVIAYPENEQDITEIYEWADKAGAAVIPWGAGSSVVGGVTSDVGARYNATISIDMGRMGKVLEVDEISRAARIQGGARGPAGRAPCAGGPGHRDPTQRSPPQAWVTDTTERDHAGSERHPTRKRARSVRGMRAPEPVDSVGSAVQAPVPGPLVSRVGRTTVQSSADARTRSSASARLS